jgi:hypothetical protein
MKTRNESECSTVSEVFRVAEHSAGQLIDALGVSVALTEGMQLVEAVVVGKAVGFDEGSRGTSLVIGSSEGLDWIAQRALLGAALDIVRADVIRDPRDDDD